MTQLEAIPASYMRGIATGATNAFMADASIPFPLPMPVRRYGALPK